MYLPDALGACEAADALEREGWETSVQESEDVCLLVKPVRGPLLGHCVERAGLPKAQESICGPPQCRPAQAQVL